MHKKSGNAFKLGYGNTMFCQVVASVPFDSDTILIEDDDYMPESDLSIDSNYVSKSDISKDSRGICIHTFANTYTFLDKTPFVMNHGCVEVWPPPVLSTPLIV